MSSPSVRRAQAALRRAIAPAAAIALTLAPVLARAQDTPAKPVILRDAETEQLLRDYAAPIFRAAAIDAKAIEIILINDLSFNAFVANGRKIFLNLGALMEAETPNEIVGVIAHETGHIAGGHLARLRDQIANAKILSVAMTGGQELIRRSLLSYQRSEEQAADQAAVRYLRATGQSPKGLLATFRRFAESGMFRSKAIDPYLVSHPLPDERIASSSRWRNRART